MMMLIGFCIDSLKKSICYYYTNSMFCSSVTHWTVGPPSLLYKSQFGSSNVWSCQKEFLSNSDNYENSGQPLPVGLESEMVYFGGEKKNPSLVKVFTSVANYKIVLLFALPDMLVYLTS